MARRVLSALLLFCVMTFADLRAGARTIAAPDQAPPVALTASDGTGLRIVSYQARAAVEDPLAFTELHLAFQNPEPRQIEGQLEITLPPGAVVSRFAMRQPSGWQEGEVVELQAARAAYEDFLHRRQDPALLEKQAGNRFHARVFPIPASGVKELIISYSQELAASEEPYRLPLRGLPKLDRLDIRVLLGKRQVAQAPSTLGGVTMAHDVIEVSKRDFTPDVDFSVPLPAADGGARLGLRHENLAVARITPVTDAAPEPVESLLVLFDSSASRALGFAAQVDRLAEVLRSLAQNDQSQIPLEVACFDQEVVEIYSGPLSGFGQAARRAILERRALGASDLSRALAWAARSKRRFARVLVVTDGVATAGATGGAELRKAVAALGQAGVRRVDALVVGGLRDEAALKRLVAGGLAKDGVVLDDALDAGTVARKLASATWSGIKISAPGASWVWPVELNGIQPGDQVLVYADLPAMQPLEIVLEGARAGRHPVKLSPVERPLLERAWVAARLKRLDHQRETLAASDPDLAEALRKQIIDLSIKFRVLCDHTALLVLESESDYARFHIDRRALADILVVGAGGVEIMNRRDAVVPMVGIPPETNENVDGRKDDDQPRRPGQPPSPAKAPARPAREVSGERKEVQADVSRPPPPSGAASAPPASPVTTSPPRPQMPMPKPTPNRAPEAESRPEPAEAPPAQTESGHGRRAHRGSHDDERARVVVSDSRIEILERIYFREKSRVIQSVSFPILDAIAATLQNNPQFTRIEIQGHSDERAGEATQAVTAGRAEAVRHYLVQKGVAPERLLARGYGATRPLCAEHVESCWAKNRRVEFVILEANGQVAQTSPPPTPQEQISPYTGRLAEVMALVKERHTADALKAAFAWHDGEPGDVLALIALGEAAEASQKRTLAARAYGSLIDLFPSRADVRRFAGERLERLADPGAAELAIDTYRKARADRPDHPASHRLLAYALLRAGDPAGAFDVITEGAKREYPPGRFAGVDRILREDAGLIAAAWARKEPARRSQLVERLAGLNTQIADGPSLRFVLNWETDANDVDFHIFDARGNHAYYSSKQLASGGELYADVTTGYGPECFTIPGKPQAFPYKLQAHYYSRGPMGYGMGKLEIIEHDGHGGLKFEERPFVIMVDHAFVDLGMVQGPLASR